ncbi:insoluble domain protein [Rhodococcus kroppenstedtii]|uniref:insoluble domain protein n=1 Tax=Rhodococcoides kroppenstedtii TaxID=293050 RepID=UPI001C9A5575|nr:insoluble domain protein [Rhodococcus kroppenstedtii]MBY6438164.1 insoluble domain protein [Rhodococcus kroppenstedtii]
MGRHKLPTRSLTRVAATATAASAMAVFCYGTASADPGDAPTTQGGVTTAPPATQGPLTSDAPTTQGALTTPAPSAPVQAERVYWTPPPPQYQQTQWRTWDAYYEQESAPAPSTADVTGSDTAPTLSDPAPLDVTQLHGPVPVEATAPIAAPDRTVKIGDYYDDQPNWMSDNVRDRTNNSTAVIEAQVTDFWRSIGVPTDRAQRLAASQLTLTAGGALTGAAAVGVPAAVGGALVGGTIGGIGGAAVGGLVPIAPGIAPITTGVAGTAGGAAVGAAAAGAVGAGIGGLVSGAAGFVAGAAYGAGDLGEPTKVEIPEFDQPAITGQTEQVVDAVESVPGGTETVALWTEPPTPADDARAFVAAQPGGDQVLGALDQAASDIAASELAPSIDVIGNAIAAAFAPAAPA